MITTHILASFRAVLFAVSKVHEKSHGVCRVPLRLYCNATKRPCRLHTEFFSSVRKKNSTVFVHFIAVLIFTKIFSLRDLSVAILSTLY